MISFLQSGLRSILIQRRVYYIKHITLAITYFSVLYLLIGYYGDIVKISPTTKSSILQQHINSKRGYRLIPALQYPSWLSLKYIQKYLEEYKESEERKDSTLACQLPSLQPFNPVILAKLNEELPPVKCENEKYPLIFNSTMKPSSRLFPVKSKAYIQGVLRVNSCCMRKIKGYEEGLGYGEVDYGKVCLPLSLETKTEVPSLWEYLVVECKFESSGNMTKRRRRIDVHSFIHHDNQRGYFPEGMPPNVLVLGIDSTSRLNFRRVLPEIHDFLVGQLSAVEMKGYHKIGENTFPNVGALLTNMKPIYNGSRLDRDVQLGCEQKPDMTYDGCPFIWKDFKAQGYKTFYAEDGVGVDPFYLWRGGFEKPPTDYFLRPFMSAAWELHEGASDPLALCYGPRTGFRRLMDSVERMASVMNKSQSPYFGFVFSGPSTHNFLNGGRYIVNDLLETLKLLYNEGYLNNTVLMVLSDHGNRVGDIRKLYQLFLEDRHPFLYVALPKWLRQKYPLAYENLKTNGENRLVTPFDVYETLVDLLPTSKLGNSRSNLSNGFGKSLFTEIPKERSCKTAGIIKAFCTCNLVLAPLSTENPSLIEAVKHAVSQLNYLIENNGEKSKCANLTLKNSSLVSAEAVLNSKTNTPIFYRIVYETVPGNALFEAMINFDSKRQIVYENTSKSDSVLKQGKFTGSLQRINLYKEDSWCIEDNGLKPFCFCKNPNEAAKKISNYISSTAEGNLKSGYLLKYMEDYLQEAMENENIKRRERINGACQLPILQPYNPEIRHVLGENTPKLNCEIGKYPLIFDSQIEPYPRLIPVKSLAHYRAYYGILFCCMRKINTFTDKQDSRYGNECLPVSLENETKVPLDWEFLVVECEFLPTSQVQKSVLASGKTQRAVDVFSFVRVNSTKPDKEKYGPLHPNVLILALGATSWLNFRRVFPEIHTFLMKNLSAVEFKEYHKVGADTFSNIGSILANKKLTFNEFGEAGYKTFYGTDSNKMSDFNFMKPPKGVFLTEFISAAVQSVGHDGFRTRNKSPCFGPRLAFTVLMDNLEKFVVQVEKTKSPYFGFVYSDSVTHDSLNGGRRIVGDLLKSLQFFHGNGYLNNTVLILLSDHGIQSGDMINYFQGYMEERLPLLYVTFPKWFPREYADAYGILKKNAEERLVTPFDVYETLVDLLPSEKFWTSGKSSRGTEGPGRSLFSPIPESRNCETAGIPKEFCSCNLKLVPEPTRNLIIIQAANYHVNKINKLLKKRGNKSCAELNLNYDLISAETLTDLKTNATVLHRIVFETFPGNANYEVLVNLEDEAKDYQTVYEYAPLQGNAGRVNLYRDDSWCIRDKRLKPFCHCGNLHELNLKYKLDFKPYQDHSFTEQ